MGENIGELLLISLGHANLGTLGLRTGNIAEAEVSSKRGIECVKGINIDVLVYCYINLAYVLQIQGKIAEARTILYRTLTISHKLQAVPLIGFAFVALGNFRITQVLALTEEEDGTQEKTRLLQRARRTLQRVLLLEGIEVETRTEGKLVLAQADLLSGQLNEAYEQATSALEEARTFEQVWLVARAHRILGEIRTAQLQLEQAQPHFERSARLFRKHGMRLELGRTLQANGEMWLSKNGCIPAEYKRGLDLLQESRKLFVECEATLGVQLVDRVLAAIGPAPQA
jgi:tetratricopeptide (TPR) repeat protein